MWRIRAFTLLELLVVLAIIAILVAIILPLTSKARAEALVVHCESNLRQIGAGLLQYANDNKHLPERPYPLDITNPHVFHYSLWDPSMAELMQKYVGSRSVLYCPANALGRDATDWWPYKSGTIAGSYQYPFWLNEYMWMIPKPDYHRLTAEKILAADYLGVTATFDGVIHVVAWNHELTKDGSPRGMNMLFGDQHVEWRTTRLGWQLYGYGFGQVYWFYVN